MKNKGNALRARAERVADTCYVVRLRAFNRVISRLYNEALSAGGLTISQFNILTAIVKREPVAPAWICAVLHLEKSTLSRNIELMRRNGWISTESEGRALLISMTDQGRRLYENALPLWERAQRKARELAGEEIFRRINSAVRSLGRE
jgi:DNA-binding MarR family transcriptional regulator